MSDIVVRVDDCEMIAEWTDENPETQASVEAALPVAGDATRWGDELYVRTDVDVEPESTTETVPVGGLAYWPGGNAICLFWGPTPASTDSRPRAAAPVNVFARVANTDLLDSLDGGARLRLERP